MRSVAKCVRTFTAVLFAGGALIAPVGFPTDFDDDGALAATAAQEAESAASFANGYDRPARTAKGSRSPVMAPHGMVAGSQPLAVQVGVDILKAGGNAIDAAVAVNAMLGLVEPHMNGVGGDLFALVWHADSEQLYALNGTGRAPASLNAGVYHEQGLDRVPGSGPLSWTVPGAVDGWEQLIDRFGSMELAQILAPAIGYAREGFPVSEIIAGQWQAEAERLAEWPGSASTYLPDGRAPVAGQLFRNPDLATVYESIARDGRDAFYQGAIAGRIADYSAEVGGHITREDLRAHTSTWVDPVSSTYRGYEVWQLPPNSHGITALMMLNILEGYDLPALGHNSADTLHRMIEAKKLAFADRTRFVADPEFNALPIHGLISKPYGDRRRALIDVQRAATAVDPGNPEAMESAVGSGAASTQTEPRVDLLEQGDTVYLTVVDRHGNAVSLIQSIFSAFGSKVVPPGLGFALQNRATGFSLEPGHPNFLEPNKRSLHTNMPGMVTREGRPWLVYGVMGGNMQPQGHAQVLANLIDFGMNVQEAGDAARFRHIGGADGGRVLLESGVTDEVFEALRRLGHDVRRAGGGWMGGYQAIFIDPQSGVLHGGSDPRKDGLAIGY